MNTPTLQNATSAYELAVMDLINGGPITRERVETVERLMLATNQSACPVVHRFGPGVYIREICVAEGVFAIGQEHRFAQTNIFVKGRVIIFKEDGSREELVAPMCFVGPPGKKIGYIHEEMVWLNVYATDETDIDKLEEMFFIKSTTLNAQKQHVRASEYADRQEDRDDFFDAIGALGVSAETVRAQSEDEATQIPFPHGNYKVKVADSAIEGRGLFATADIVEGEIIAPARYNNMRTPAGRYTNHAKSPNARAVIANACGDINFVAMRHISGCRGGLDGEEITADYRQCIEECLKYDRETSCQR